ncbi:hypothetical protein ADL15_34275 [Actinoplanes awajinensis subsp. mycoplanecinus]|uniref:Uncharacterized protein n=1 Tax=Actinoplanes awajinensis subsp. mycoplanecinus TaxID=135947 RepID=A0A117MP10_9ACTN|nr:hypothetical protein ADL15_34275 [Actinoplanes awajinensis subsp. mycoplanecinus]
MAGAVTAAPSAATSPAAASDWPRSTTSQVGSQNVKPCATASRANWITPVSQTIRCRSRTGRSATRTGWSGAGFGTAGPAARR